MFVEGSINWNFQKINNLCYTNRSSCAKNVAAYFEKYQESLVEQQASIDAQMKTIYAQNPVLAAEKATALGKDLAEQVFEMSTSVLHELETYLEAGDFSTEFVPTAMTEDLMPVYSFENIGGTGLETKDDQSKDDQNNENQNKEEQIKEEEKKEEKKEDKVDQKVDKVTNEDKNVDKGAAKTGDSNLLIVYVMAAIISMVVIVKRKLSE